MSDTPRDDTTHPLQYAIISGLDSAQGTVVYGTENMPDDQVLWTLRLHPGNLSASALWMLDHLAAYRPQIRIERYNRCPICEQWSPCKVRAAAGRTP